MINAETCQQARLARDARFDGLFFTAVKSTGIYCRPICPARPPAEQQVSYYQSAAEASAAGYRPCLRCRPDSAPGSAAWQGTDTTVQRALRLIDDGVLQQQTQAELASRLGISERYLRKLFQQQLGLAPKQYALAQQVLFAKKLLHETRLPISSIAFHAGFNSVRRFNDAFKQQLKLCPGDIRRHPKDSGAMLQLTLSYRPPLAWTQMLDFWRARTLDGIDWVNGQRYGRSFSFMQQDGWFEVAPAADNNLTLQLHWPAKQGLFSLIRHLRRLLDLDANMLQIEQQLSAHPLFNAGIVSGLRIPGVWNAWEAGVRAILGQQVSVAGARTQLNRLVQALGQPLSEHKRLFPTPQAVAQSDLQMIKVPQARRATLTALAQYVMAQPDAPPQHWLAIKGIGPWTVNYACLRGLSDSDIWLGGDLGVQKALAKAGTSANIDSLSPWRSYATFQLWFSLGG
ncbi:helix-turn-helix domain-containing protein [Rheinheimera muenzenbergensis]|uniref:DNA-3-methyladenine glycosylase II n=1 Tax=Rheinheimera muenzenbergensis TaxID=1193628 RepID=A0ABU8C5B3_9GAMM